MELPKLSIIMLMIMIISLFILDYFSASLLYMNLEAELERTIINAMYESTHFGALRDREVRIGHLEDVLTRKIDEYQSRGIQVTVNILSESPAMVEVEAVARHDNMIGKWISDVTETPIRIKKIIVGDLERE